MNKIVFIIPGYAESKNNNPAYLKIAGYFKNKNIKPIIIDIDWQHKTILDYVEQFKKICARQEKKSEFYFFGFSYGAMIAFISSVELKPKLQILCSLSPYFKEDLPHIKESWKKLNGKRRMTDFQKISFNNLAKKTFAKTIVLAGDKEGEEIERRAKEANKRIKNSKLIIIPNAKHKIEQDEYLESVKKIISNL